VKVRLSTRNSRPPLSVGTPALLLPPLFLPSASTVVLEVQGLVLVVDLMIVMIDYAIETIQPTFATHFQANWNARSRHSKVLNVDLKARQKCLVILHLLEQQEAPANSRAIYQKVHWHDEKCLAILHLLEQQEAPANSRAIHQKVHWHDADGTMTPHVLCWVDMHDPARALTRIRTTKKEF